MKTLVSITGIGIGSVLIGIAGLLTSMRLTELNKSVNAEILKRAEQEQAWKEYKLEQAVKWEEAKAELAKKMDTPVWTEIELENLTNPIPEWNDPK